MRSFLIYFLVLFCLLFNINSVFAQGRVEIDSIMDMSPLYLPTAYSNLKFIEYEPLVFNPIDTGLINTHYFDPYLKPENIYQNLGVFGQAHQPIVFNYQREMGFLYQALHYPLFFKKQSDLQFYKLQTTYSKIAYTFGLPKENEIFALFTRHIKGVTVAANMYATYNDGSFVHQKTQNICGDIIVHYELPSSIYRFRASYIINHLKSEENGGLLDMQMYQDSMQNIKFKDRNNRMFSVFSDKDATSQITTHDFVLHNYVNIKNKNDTYFGTFSYDFQGIQTSTKYTDLHDSLKYEHYYYANEFTKDTLRYIQVKNVFQWSNFMPYKELSNKNNFFHIAGGILHDFADLKYEALSFNSFYLFARAHIRLFKLMEVKAKISYSFSGYTNNDVIANAGISWAINREKKHFIGGEVSYFRCVPEYIMKTAATNNYQWDTLFSKQNVVQLKAFWNYKKYNASVSYYYLSNYIYLSEQLRPAQNKNIGNMVQFSTYIPFRHKNFGATANLNLQYCTNNVVQVPLFAGKASVYYIFEFLKKRLKIMVGADLMYNTSYYADAYIPVLHKFYRQESQLIGNFLFLDASLTVSIDRINFFFRIGNIVTPLMGYRNFTTPDYPVNDYAIGIGISWRFFD